MNLFRNLLPVLGATVKTTFFPSDPLAALRSLFVALSLLVLFKHASAHEFSQTLQLFVNTYDDLLTRLLSPMQPVLDSATLLISSLFRVDLILQGYWKHVFVLLSIYFFSRAAGAYALKRYGTAVFRILWGVSVALVFSLGASLESGQSAPISQEYRVAFSAVFSVVVYELGINIWFATFFREAQATLHRREIRTWWSEFLNLSKEDGIRFVVGAVLVVSLLLISWPEYVTRPELVAVALVALIHGIFWTIWGWRQTRFELKISVRLRTAKSNGDVVVGMAMIRSFAYALVAVVLDAAASLL